MALPITIEILPHGPVQIRHFSEEIGFRREVRSPGDDLSDLPEDIRAMIAAAWTPQKVADWEAMQMPLSLTVNDYATAIQAHLDAKARERQYDSILTAITYRDDPNEQFAAEAEALFAWRSAVWTAAATMLAAFEPGSAPSPADDVIAALPTFDWPA